MKGWGGGGWCPKFVIIMPVIYLTGKIRLVHGGWYTVVYNPF